MNGIPQFLPGMGKGITHRAAEGLRVITQHRFGKGFPSAPRGGPPLPQGAES